MVMEHVPNTLDLTRIQLKSSILHKASKQATITSPISEPQIPSRFRFVSFNIPLPAPSRSHTIPYHNTAQICELQSAGQEGDLTYSKPSRARRHGLTLQATRLCRCRSLHEEAIYRGTGIDAIGWACQTQLPFQDA
jgi:hypothetical protein